jgi:hypothetical protein
LLGNCERAREMVRSILSHVQNIHTFPENQHYKACTHGDLGEQADRQPWIREGELPFGH